MRQIMSRQDLPRRLYHKNLKKSRKISTFCENSYKLRKSLFLQDFSQRGAQRQSAKLKFFVI